jgi:hypothetical protein
MIFRIGRCLGLEFAENIPPSKPLAQFLYNLGGFQQSSASSVVTTLNNGNGLLKRRLAVATQELELTKRLIAAQQQLEEVKS